MNKQLYEIKERRNITLHKGDIFDSEKLTQELLDDGAIRPAKVRTIYIWKHSGIKLKPNTITVCKCSTSTVESSTSSISGYETVVEYEYECDNRKYTIDEYTFRKLLLCEKILEKDEIYI